MLLLHLSDIHFRHEEIRSSMDPNYHLRNKLLLDAQVMCKQLDKIPSAILISGDIAYAAHKNEYDFALEWIDKLATACGTSIENVFVVPGNHDVVRDKASKPMVQALHNQIKTTSLIDLDEKLRELLADEETSRVLYAPLDPFNFFAGQFFCSVSAPERMMAKRDLPLNDGSILRLAGLNSAFVSSKEDKEGELFIDPSYSQLTSEPGIEYLTICHHPYSWLKNGNNLKDHLNDVAKIQLFGHAHTNRIELNRDFIQISASAAHPDRTEYGWEPGYNLIELDVTRTGSERILNLTTHVRIWQSRPGQFHPKMDRTKNYFEHKIPLENWVPPQVKVDITENPIEPLILESTHLSPEQQLPESDPMDTLRNISIRFFKLTLSQKSEISGKLELIEDEDINQPDFERFRRVFLRAHERGLVEALDKEIAEINKPN